MEYVRVFVLHLIILTNKLTVKKWIKLSCLRLNSNSKERKELFMNLKLIKAKEVLEVFAILWKAGLMKSSRLLTISHVLMRQHLEVAAVEQQVTILFKLRLTF